jgi:hypothetical protein
MNFAFLHAAVLLIGLIGLGVFVGTSAIGKSAIAFLGAWWLWLLIGLIMLGAFVGRIWWPKWQVHRLRFAIRDAKARADVEDNFRKTYGQLLGGIAVLVGAAFAYLQFTQQQRAAHDLLISNQVAKGFEQLASEKLEMRLGGVYALEGVMNTSERYHKPVLEALSAIVRERTKETAVRTSAPEAVSADIQAVLTVIARREIIRRNFRYNFSLDPGDVDFVDLSYSHIPNAFLRDAKLMGAYLKETNLSNANLVMADLRGADLEKANLRNAGLFGADLRHVWKLTQAQLDEACGEYVTLDPPLTIKPCPREVWRPGSPAGQSGTDP